MWYLLCACHICLNQRLCHFKDVMLALAETAGLEVKVSYHPNTHADIQQVHAQLYKCRGRSMLLPAAKITMPASVTVVRANV